MIENTTIKSNKIFSLFPEYSLEQAVVVPKQKNETKLLSVKDEVSINTGKEGKSKKKKILFGSTIASTVLTVGVASLLLVKGPHGSYLGNKISKFNTKLAQDLHEAGQSNAKDIPTKIAYHTKKKIKKLLDLLQASSNFTAFKDYGSNKLLHTNKVTGAFADKSTAAFKEVVDGTLGKSYSGVQLKIKDLTSLLQECDIKTLKSLDPVSLSQNITIKDKTMKLSEWIDILESQTKRLETSFERNFSLGARKMRDKKRMRLLSDLPEKIHKRFFKNQKSLFNIKNYKTYATEDLSLSAREELRRDIVHARKEVTNNISSITQQVKSSLDTFYSVVKPSDNLTRDSVQKLKKQLLEFKNCSGANEAKARSAVSDEIALTINEILKGLTSNSLYNASEQKVMQQLLDEVKVSVLSTGSSSKGALEEIMTVLKGLNSATLEKTGKKVLSDAEFSNFTKLSEKISKGLKNATDLEAGEYFIKQAELKVGSAPTDVMSVLFPVGVGAYSIAKADDKDERISATLTTCIPLVGTFATFVYGTVKMFSGAKNLIFSGVSGLALGALGNYCDKLYKKYKNSGSAIKVAKDEYDKIWTGFETPEKNEKKAKL